MRLKKVFYIFGIPYCFPVIGCQSFLDVKTNKRSEMTFLWEILQNMTVFWVWLILNFVLIILYKTKIFPNKIKYYEWVLNADFLSFFCHCYTIFCQKMGLQFTFPQFFFTFFWRTLKKILIITHIFITFSLVFHYCSFDFNDFLLMVV